VGIEVLPEGRRKSGLSAKLVDLISQLFGSRILAFDQAAAVKYAALVSQARTAGCVISVGDGQIAAIAASHNFTVATRDTKPFLAAGIPVINPFEY
jgi:toxin FitB